MKYKVNKYDFKIESFDEMSPAAIQTPKDLLWLSHASRNTYMNFNTKTYSKVQGLHVLISRATQHLTPQSHPPTYSHFIFSYYKENVCKL
jgi:hypothetical protein